MNPLARPWPYAVAPDASESMASISRSPRWSSDYRRILLALILEFNSHRGEILKILAKMQKNEDQLLRTPSSAGRYTLRRESTREENTEFFSRQKGKHVPQWGGGRRAHYVTLDLSYYRQEAREREREREQRDDNKWDLGKARREKTKQNKTYAPSRADMSCHVHLLCPS